MTQAAIPAGIAALVASGVVLVAGQQVPAAPVFTVQQATAGRAVYAKHCASCHMPDLSGNVEYPPLEGAAFMSTWGTREAVATAAAEVAADKAQVRAKG